MSLITPDFGLLFWMVIIFGMVFFLLAKFGFPVIGGMVEKRSNHIADSLKAAEDAQKKLLSLADDQARMIEETRQQQGLILKEASDARDSIIAQAKEQATKEAAKVLEDARRQIEAEREAAISEIRAQVAVLSMGVAETIVRRNLESPSDQAALIDRMVEEAKSAKLS